MVEHGRKQIYDKERIHWNTAWLKRNGEHFEVVINPDEALSFRKTGKPDVPECLRSEHVFHDAKRGELASEEKLKGVFGTDKALDVARVLLTEGELQLSAEHRAQMRDAKRNQVISWIEAYAVDPKTGLPHPRKRIELAMEEAKVRIDERKDVQEQMPDIMHKLRPVIPIKLETVTLQIHLPVPYGQKLYGDLQRLGTLKKTEWLKDGSLMAWLEVPAGKQMDVLDELGSKTHGAAETKKVEETPV